MDTSSHQEFDNMDTIDESFLGVAAIEQYTDHKPSFSEIEEEPQESNAATPNISGLVIKVEPGKNDVSANVPIEAVQNVYAHECSFSTCAPYRQQIPQARHKRERNLIDNLDQLHSDPALNEFTEYSSIKEEALVKIETNFEEIQEVNINECMIKNEDLHFKDLEGSEARSEEGISAQKRPPLTGETNDEKKMHEIAFKDCKIKNEDIDIKEELEECESVSISRDSVHQDIKCERCRPEKSNQFGAETSLRELRPQHKHPKGGKSDLLECIKCSYQTGYKHTFKKRVKSRDFKIFKCKKCDFQTKYKNSLKNHRLQHSNSEDVKKFKCGQCSYRTILTQRLKRHLLRHRTPENVEMFKCNKCDFQTKYKNSLKSHRLKHNSSEDVKKFKCDQCSYETVYKENLKRHLPRHMDPEQIFKCKKCDFQSKHKLDLKTHQLRHNNFDDVKKFKCDQCSYQTIYKENLKKHLLRHMNPEQVEMFKCNHCYFQTRYKRSLKAHLLRHKTTKFNCG